MLPPTAVETTSQWYTRTALHTLFFLEPALKLFLTVGLSLCVSLRLGKIVYRPPLFTCSTTLFLIHNVPSELSQLFCKPCVLPLFGLLKRYMNIQLCQGRKTDPTFFLDWLKLFSKLIKAFFYRWVKSVFKINKTFFCKGLRHFFQPHSRVLARESSELAELGTWGIFWIFSIIKVIFLQVNNLFLHQSYLAHSQSN